MDFLIGFWYQFSARTGLKNLSAKLIIQILILPKFFRSFFFFLPLQQIGFLIAPTLGMSTKSWILMVNYQNIVLLVFYLCFFFQHATQLQKRCKTRSKKMPKVVTLDLSGLIPASATYNQHVCVGQRRQQPAVVSKSSTTTLGLKLSNPCRYIFVLDAFKHQGKIVKSRCN